MTSSGFNSIVFTKKPQKRKAKALWNTVRRVSGMPPSMMEYRPPNRWHTDDDGNRIWRKTAEWVIHHEMGRFLFKGSAQKVAEQIELEGLELN